MSEKFTLERKATFTGECPIPIPGEKDKVLELEFRWMEDDESKAFIESMAEKEDGEIMKEIIVDWHNVDAEFSHENIDRLLQSYPGCGVHIARYWISESRGAKRKNL